MGARYRGIIGLRGGFRSKILFGDHFLRDITEVMVMHSRKWRFFPQLQMPKIDYRNQNAAILQKYP